MNVIFGVAVFGSVVAGYVYRRALSSLFSHDADQNTDEPSATHSADETTQPVPLNVPKAVNTQLKKVQNEKRSSMSWDGTPLDYSAEALNAELHAKWARPLRLLAVHTDIPRLIRKMEIRADDGTFLLRFQIQNHDTMSIGPGEVSRIVLMKTAFLALCSQLHQDDTRIKEEFDTYFHDEEGELALSMMNFLNKVIGEENRITKVLKACNQSMLAPAVVRMKVGLNQQVSFKDVQGGWRISISFLPDDGSPKAKGKGYCRVVHLRQEQSFDSAPESKFELSWKLVLLFDRDISELLETRVMLTSLTFSPAVPLKQRHHVSQSFTQFFANYQPQAELQQFQL